MQLDTALVAAVCSAAAAIGAALITIRTSKIAVGPATDEALTKRFMALIETQDRKIAKLEANLADLEIKLIKDDAWAEEVMLLAARRSVTLPPRPKFSHFTGAAE